MRNKMTLDKAIIRIMHEERIDTDELISWLRELRELRDELQYTKKFILPMSSNKLLRQDYLRRCEHQLETLVSLSKLD